MADTALLECWRDLSPQALERAYDSCGAAAEQPAILRRWARDSALLRRAHPDSRLDLAYGSDPHQQIDLFLPPPSPGGQRPPLLLYLHGGCWQSLGKSHYSLVATGPLARGFAVAVAGYRPCPAASLAEMVEDARNACLFLWQHGQGLGIDRERMVAAGHAIGGHLAATLLATRWASYGRRHPRDLVAAAVGLSGLYQLEPLLETRLGRALGLDLASARALAPVYLEPPYSAAMLLAVGRRECAEQHRQSEALAARWPDQGVAVDLLLLARHNHYTLIDELADAEGLLCTLLPALLAAARD